MAAATLNLNVVDKRMLSASEAASYCGLPAKHFKTICPVPTIRLADRPLYDKRDLDHWIETEKAGSVALTQEDILARLP